MTLDIKISIVVVDSQVAQHPLRLRQGILEFGETALQLEHLRPHLLAQILYRPLRILNAYRGKHHHLVELTHIEVHRHLTALQKDYMPYKERPDGLGIRLQEALKVENAMVVECHHHAGFVQSLGVTLEVFYRISISMKDVGILQHLFRHLRRALQNIVVVGIHTGYHVSAHTLEHIGNGSLLAPVEMLIARRQHDIES